MDLKLYRPRNLTVEQLDSMMAFVIGGGAEGGYLKAIISAIKLLVCMAYMIARDRLIELELMIERQTNEQNKDHDGDNNVNT